jgi:phosphatidylglycerol:prolipoprotein diacylglycerol transferase
MTSGELVTLLGYATGGAVFYWQARSRRLATEGVGKIALIGLLCGVAGSVVAQALVGGGAGRSVVGGIVGGWLGVELAKRAYGLKRGTGDLFALALPAGEAVGRIGCFLNGCCYGLGCDEPWRVWQHGAWRHPTQLYSAAVAAAIFGALYWGRLRNPPDGTLFRWFLFLFGAGRLAVEFWRVNPPVFAGLTVAQWVGLELMAMSLLMSWLAARRSSAPIGG